MDKTASQKSIQRSCRSVQWLIFFVADIQTGVGPFLASFLAASGWTPREVGYTLTLGYGVMLLAESPVGALIDWIERKRVVLFVALGLLATAATMLTVSKQRGWILFAQVFTGLAAAALPTGVAAITLGIVGQRNFDRQVGRNQSYDSAGNAFAALFIAGLSWVVGMRWIFLSPILFSIPALIMLRRIDPAAIDNEQARAGAAGGGAVGVRALMHSGVLLTFLACAFLFHLANGAMLPQLGEMLARGDARKATPFMSACMIVTQIVMSACAAPVGGLAERVGRKPLLLVAFACLPVRGFLYTLTHAATWLVSIQVLDGLANALFSVVALLVMKDLTRGSGRFALGAGMLATCVGLGQALSPGLGGEIVQRYGFNISFLTLGAIALIPLAVFFMAVPETLARASEPPSHSAIQAAPRP